MGGKDALGYLRAGAAKRGVGEEQREDGDLPLGARIGSLVNVQQSPLIRASAAGSLLALPDDAGPRIVAISQLKLNLAGKLYRYYLAKGDDDAQERFLQLYQNEQCEVAEILYCSQLARVIPETEEDQDAYTGSQGYGLGDPSYTLWREQLAEQGYAASVLDAAFGPEAGAEYQRDVGGGDFVPPFTGTETRIDDAGGMQGLRQELYFMPYARSLGDGGKEYLLITTEILQSVNGAGKRGIHVDFVVGIPVEQERLVIQ